MTAIGYSQKIGDSIPNEGWYDKWLNWSIDRGNKDLEIAKGGEHSIPFAYKHDINDLPEIIKEKYYSELKTK